MTKRISDLTPTVTLVDSDLFLMTDTLNGASKSITFQALESMIFDSTVFTATGRQASLVSALNAHNPDGVGKNDLRATVLYSGDDFGYREGSYFLNYDNLINKPTVKTDLSEFSNTTGFIRIDDNFKLIWDGAGRYDVNSDNILEGQVNKFYSDSRTDARINQLFGALFNSYNGTFDAGEIRDSLSDVPALFANIDTLGSSNVISISNLDLRPSFSVGQTLRLYGASEVSTTFSRSTTLSLVKVGLDAVEGAVVVPIAYKICDFSLETGEISPASAAQSISASVTFVTSTSISLSEAFNNTSFVRLNFSDTQPKRGVLVYRQVGTNGAFKLIAVLGSKEVLAGTWIDYYNFDYTQWSGKSSEDNSFTSITHFPLTPPSTQRRGWVDRDIVSISNLPNSFRLTLNEAVYTNTVVGGTSPVTVFQNDTTIINNAIIANSIVGKKSVVLNAKTYNSGQIRVPNNFGITGTAYITRIKKLPWTGGETGTENGKFIAVTNATDATSISLIGVDIDGNAKNQFLFPDGTIANTNYIVDFGSQSRSVLIDKVRITDSPAGGIWATSPISLKITTSEVVNSGITDRYSYSPLIADSGDTTMIVANKFENYSKLIDLSVTNKGVLANNIISNCGDEFGYGVFIYGSVFFLSSPNVLIGPAGEFLPTPDTLNSEYDLINIDLSEALNSGDSFQSPAHVYQENGAVYDLTQSAGASPTIEYRAFYLQRTTQGVEEVYGTTYTPANFTVGKRYTIVSLGSTSQEQWNTAAGGVTGREYIVGSSFICAAAVPGGGTGIATSGGVDAIVLNPATTGYDRSLGQFAFTIDAPTVTQIKTANGAYSASTLRGLNPLHQGIGWSASYRHEVVAGTIVGSGTWTADTVDGKNPTYQVTTIDTNYIGPGTWVKLASPGWNNPKGVIEGKVISAQTTGTQTVTVILFPGAGGGTDNDPTAKVNAGLTFGTEGTLNITDTFVMAQGRII